MKFFHCSREFIEHPVTLIDSLRAGGISLELDDTQLRAVGCVDNVNICIIFHPKRFRGNLSVVEYPTLRVIWKRSDVEFILAVRRDFNLAVSEDLGIAAAEHPSFAWIATQAAVGDDAFAVFEELGISAVCSPVEDEIRFVAAQYGQRPEIQTAIRAVREQQQLVTRSVADQKFDDAAYHADKRDHLLDALYDLSMS